MHVIAASVIASILYLAALGPALLVYLEHERAAAASLIVLLALAIIGSFVN